MNRIRILLIVAFLLSLLPTATFAQEDPPVDMPLVSNVSDPDKIPPEAYRHQGIFNGLEREWSISEPDQDGMRYVFPVVEIDPDAPEPTKPEWVQVETPMRLQILRDELGIPLKELEAKSDEEIMNLFVTNAQELKIDVFHHDENGERHQIAFGLSGADGGMHRVKDQEDDPELQTVTDSAAPTAQYTRDPGNIFDLMFVTGEIHYYLRKLTRAFVAWDEGMTKEYMGFPLALVIEGWNKPDSPRIAGHYYSDRSKPYMKITHSVIAQTYELMDQTWDAGHDYDYGEPVIWADRYYYPFDPNNCSTDSVVYSVSVRSYGDTKPYVDLMFDYNYKIVDNLGLTRLPISWQLGMDRCLDLATGHVGPIGIPAARYTLRHATHMGVYAEILAGNQAVADDLLNTLVNANGSHDLYKPMFGWVGSKTSDWFLGTEPYYDCFAPGPANGTNQAPYPWGIETNWARYPYESKVCTLGVNNYVTLSKQDYLVQALQAIHVLVKHQSPAYQYIGTGGGLTTPTQVARNLEAIAWNGNGIKIFGKSSSYTSGVRTAAFTVLETILGYKYGDQTSKNYADAAMQTLVYTPWGLDYSVGTYWGETVENGLLLRPNHYGGPLLAWQTVNPLPYGLPPKTFLSEIIDHFGMPDEVDGVIPTNAETAGTIMQAMRAYMKYRHNYYFLGNQKLP
ncbi:hypothetical protein GC175_17015 [bacterium]|nr:hypothetical protein [bacterium]